MNTIDEAVQLVIEAQKKHGFELQDAIQLQVAVMVTRSIMELNRHSENIVRRLDKIQLVLERMYKHGV